MARLPVEVRSATAADVDALMELYERVRHAGAQLRLPLEQVRARLEQALLDGSVRVLLATTAEGPVGYALLSPQPLLPLGTGTTPCVEHLHVLPELRHRGVGRALLRRALALAQEDGAEELACTVLPNDREYTRYMARLGFAPVTVRRAVPLSVLRRRLVGEEASAATEDVLARRRSLRGRLARAHAAVTRFGEPAVAAEAPRARRRGTPLAGGAASTVPSAS